MVNNLPIPPPHKNEKRSYLYLIKGITLQKISQKTYRVITLEYICRLPFQYSGEHFKVINKENISHIEIYSQTLKQTEYVCKCLLI